MASLRVWNSECRPRRQGVVCQAGERRLIHSCVFCHVAGNHHVPNKGLHWRGSTESKHTGNGDILAPGTGDGCETDSLTEVAVTGANKLERSSSIADDAVHLKRRLGLFSGVALIVGTMIGSGIFVSPSGLLIRTGSVGMSFVIWVACGLLSLLGALAYAELGTMNTSSGAEYAYFMDAFGPMPAFLFSWVSTLVLKPSQMAIICLSFAKYAVEAFVTECDPPEMAVKVVSVMAIVIILFINCYSVNLATGVQNVFTAAKLVAILIVILGGWYKLFQGTEHKGFVEGCLPVKINSRSNRESFVPVLGNTQHLENVFHGSTFSFGNIATAFYTGLWAYDGWNNLNYVTEEIKNPSKNLPMSIAIAIPLVTMCYVLINISYLTVMSAAEMIESEAVAVVSSPLSMSPELFLFLVSVDLLSRTFGNRILGVMAWLIPLSVTVSTFGSANGTLFAAGRLCFAASREGHLMNILSYVHIRRFTPAPGLIFHSLIAVAMVLSGTIDSLIDFFSFTAWIFYGGAMLALIVMRFTKPDHPRPYKVPIIIPIVVLIISLYLIVAPIIDVPQIEYLYAALFIVGGLVFYIPFVYYGIHCKAMDRFTVFCQLLLEVAPTQVMFD
ncbi:hypothetical protein RUM43_010967 [Polyplax serrata]|uniref:B(0,+)-type amino acid transporter 1 n=1 Tax=Polyplax serrata TaxID=468196 RepID=A0AAN8S0M2_POLSC